MRDRGRPAPSANPVRRAPSGTDGGHVIIDAHCGRIDAPETLACGLNVVPGVVEHGLFIGLATGALVATAERRRHGLQPNLGNEVAPATEKRLGNRGRG